MERSFEHLHRELLLVYTRETKDVQVKIDTWRERFEKMRQQRNRCHEEYTTLKQENSQLRAELSSLKEQLNNSSGSNQRCSVCETLQKTLDQLREAYKQSTQEKDQLLAILDSKLAEYTDGESFLAKFRKGYSTPIKQQPVNNDGDNNRTLSDRKQSPDSTIRSTPKLHPTQGGRDAANTTADSSDHQNDDVSKDCKLSLPRRSQKRHRYIENVSPNQKRQKLVTCNENRTHDADKVTRNKKKGKKSTPSVLVPETCEFDGDQSSFSESEINQPNLSRIEEESSINEKEHVKTNSSGQSVHTMAKTKNNKTDTTGCLQEKKKNQPLIYTSNVKVIPETVGMDMFEGTSSSEEEQEDTVKRVGLTQSNYSLRSVLCSPPSSDDEEEGLDMMDVVNHRTIHLSGQSTCSDAEVEGFCKVDTEIEQMGGDRTPKSLGKDVNKFKKSSELSINHKTVVKENLSLSPFKTFGDEDDGKVWSVKPYSGSRSSQIKRLDMSSDSPRKLSRQASLISSPELHGAKTRSVERLVPLSPVFNVANKTKRSQDDVMSPGLFDNEETKVRGQGHQEEPESPLLLRVTSVLNKGEDTVSDNVKRKSPEKTEYIDLSDMDSPVLSLRSKVNRSKLPGKFEVTSDNDNKTGTSQSSNRSDLTKTKSVRLKNLKLPKNSMVVMEAHDPNMSSRQLRQTTLSQVFNNSPTKTTRGSSKAAQEENDLQRAIQLSLQEVADNLPDLDETVQEKENSPPFKKPTCPPSKSKVHRSPRSLHKGQQVINRSRSRRDSSSSKRISGPSSLGSDLDETLPPQQFVVDSKGDNRQPANGKKGKSTRKADVSLSTSQQEVGRNVQNGSIDPAIQLSQLCEDSEFILDPADIEKDVEMSSQAEALTPTNFDGSNAESHKKLHRHSASTNDDIGMGGSTQNDFRIEDLDTEHKPLMTSTCVDDLDSQSIPCSSRSVRFGAGRRKSKVISVTENFSEVSSEDHLPTAENLNSLMDDSFDRVPKKDKDGYAYVDVVRKQNERRQLQGYQCKECYDYYKGMDLPEDEKNKRMQQCSRHRAKYIPPNTPPHFWSIGFPDTQECEERGYINREEDLPAHEKRSTFRRRKKLTKIFKSKKEEEVEHKS